MPRSCLGVFALLILLTLAAAAEPLPPTAQALVPLGLFELTPSQRKAIREARQEYHAQYCDLTARIEDAQENIRELYAKDRRDPKQIGQAFKVLASLQQQLIEARVTAENRAEAVLTADQREKLLHWRAGYLPGVYADVPPYMNPRYPSGDTSLWQYERPRQYPYAPENRPAVRPP